MIEEDYGGCKQVSKVGLHIKLVYTPILRIQKVKTYGNGRD
jgi:hypothetical protein